MKRIVVASITLLAAIGTSCTGSGSVARTPTSPPATPRASLPTTSPGAATGNVSRGEASVQVAGSLEAEFTAPLQAPVVYAPPPGAFALRWVSGGNGVGIAGSSFTGTRPTSNGLAVVISVGTGRRTAFFHSFQNECRITIRTAEAHVLAGSFRCNGLKSSDGKASVDASGRFSASG